MRATKGWLTSRCGHSFSTMPYWLDAIGGYTSLGTRMLVLALAAMSLNFLLGFTGVLSFGHAAYFGLGAYGAGMTIKYLVPDTLTGIAVGVIVGTAAAALIGPLIVRLRGIYFAMATIAFGQVFYFIAFRWNSMTGGDDGLSGWRRLPIDLGFARIDILNNDKAFYYLVLVCFAISVGIMATLLRSPFGRPCSPSAKTSAAPASSVCSSTATSGFPGSYPAFSSALPGRFMPC